MKTQFNNSICSLTTSATATNLLISGNNVFGTNLKEAICFYEEATRMNSSFVEAYNNIGAALKASGDSKGAIEWYEKAINTDKKFVEAYHNKGVILFELGNTDDSESSFENVISIKPDFASTYCSNRVTFYNMIKANDSDTYCNNGMVIYNIGYAESLSFYYPVERNLNSGNHQSYLNDNAISFEPEETKLSERAKLDLANTHLDNGNVLDDMGYYESALTEYDKAINITKTMAVVPDYSRIYHNKAFALGHLGNFTEAIESYNQALKINPNIADIYYGKGVALGHLGNFTEAIESYNQALEINPNFTSAYLNKGDAYQKLGNFTEAIESYNQALEIDSNFTSAYVNKGVAHYKLGNFTEAMAAYNNATNLDPNCSYAYFNKGSLFYNRGNFSDALREYNKVIEKDPNDAAAYNNRGRVLEHWGYLDHAIENYDQSVRIDPNHVLAYCNKGKTLIQLGREKEALECFNEAYEISKSGSLNSDLSQNNLDFITRVLSEDRIALVKKIAEFLEDSMNLQEKISTTLDPSDAISHAVDAKHTDLKQDLVEIAKTLDFDDGDDKDSVRNMYQVKELSDQMEKVEVITEILPLVQPVINNLHVAKVPEDISLDPYKASLYTTIVEKWEMEYKTYNFLYSKMAEEKGNTFLCDFGEALGKLGNISGFFGAILGVYSSELAHKLEGLETLAAITPAVVDTLCTINNVANNLLQDKCPQNFAKLADSSIDVYAISHEIALRVTDDRRFINYVNKEGFNTFDLTKEKGETDGKEIVSTMIARICGGIDSGKNTKDIVNDLLKSLCNKHGLLDTCYTYDDSAVMSSLSSVDGNNVEMLGNNADEL